MENLEEKKDEVKQDEFVETGDTRTPGEGEGEASSEGVAEPEQGAPQITNEEQVVPETTFTQSQVNEMVGKARKEGRESAMKALFERYGVDSDDELSDLFGRGQSYDDISFDLENNRKELINAKSENALLRSGISPDRWDDAKAILGAKGLEISEETLKEMLPTHPEWIKNADGKQVIGEEDLQQKVDEVAQREQTPAPAKLVKLGNEPTPPQQKTDREEASALFGFQL